MKSPRVFVDTNVLFPASLADLTLSASEYGLFELVYSDHLLTEIQRVLVDHKGLAPASAQRFIDEICETFPSGRLASSAYEGTAASWTGRRKRGRGGRERADRTASRARARERV